MVKNSEMPELNKETIDSLIEAGIQVGNNFVKKQVEILLNASVGYFDDMSKYLQKPEELREVVHKMSGHLALMGSEKLHKKLKSFENDIIKGQNFGAEQIEMIHEDFDQFISSFNTYIDEQD